MENDQSNDNATERTEHLLRLIEEHLAAIRQAQDSVGQDWLTVQEAARKLRVSRDTVERLINTGKLQAVAIRSPNGRGRRRRFRIKREWLERFLLEQCDQLRPNQSRPTKGHAHPPYQGPDFVD